MLVAIMLLVNSTSSILHYRLTNSGRMSQSQLLAILMIIASVDLQQFVVAQIQQMVIPKVIAGSGIGQCPLQGERRAAIDDISKSIMDTLQLQYPCGDGVWYCVAHLNMSDPSQQCPLAWRKYNASGVRACGRPFAFRESCSSTAYTIGRLYSKVYVW